MKLGTGILLGVVIAAVAIWFVAVYDTAEGRCNRGDVGACTVILGRQQAAADQAAAAAAATEAARVALAAASARAVAEERAVEGRCQVGLDDHNAVVIVLGTDAAETCELMAQSLGGGWRTQHDAAGLAPDAREICLVPYGAQTGAEQLVQVVDTGDAFYGSDVCDSLMGYGS